MSYIKSFVHIFGVAQNFGLNGGSFKAIVHFVSVKGRSRNYVVIRLHIGGGGGRHIFHVGGGGSGIFFMYLKGGSEIFFMYQGGSTLFSKFQKGARFGLTYTPFDQNKHPCHLRMLPQNHK